MSNASAVASPTGSVWFSGTGCSPVSMTVADKFTAYALVYLSFPVSVIASFCNAVNLYAIIKFPKLQTSSNILLGVLSVTDLLVGVFVLPCYMAICIADVTGRPDCLLRLLHGYASHFLCGSSAFMLAVISVDRCIKVTYPLRCKSWNLRPAYSIAIFCGMFLLLAIVILRPLSLIGRDKFSVIASCFIACVILVPIASYLIILKVVRGSNRVAIDNTCGIQQIKRRRKEARTAKVIGILILVLFACYTPRLFLVSERNHSQQSEKYPVNRWSAFFVFFNAAVNPIIYWSRIDDFKQGVALTLSNMVRSIGWRFGARACPP